MQEKEVFLLKKKKREKTQNVFIKEVVYPSAILSCKASRNNLCGEIVEGNIWLHQWKNIKVQL